MITKIHRFESKGGSEHDLYIVFYASGTSRDYIGFKNLPKTARKFIAAARNFEFCKSKATGEFYHRFS